MSENPVFRFALGLLNSHFGFHFVTGSGSGSGLVKRGHKSDKSEA